MKKILIVEDENVLRNALCTIFKKKGFTVYQANDGKEGLDTAILEHPDLIIADIAMPIMTGEKMIEAIRQDIWGKTIPIVVVTNFADFKLKFLDKNIHIIIKSDTKLKEILEKINSILYET